jgi:hypothetical protein
MGDLSTNNNFLFLSDRIHYKAHKGHFHHDMYNQLCETTPPNIKT